MEKEKIALVWPEWEVEKQLGKGSYGVVYQAIRRDNNITSRAAIKVISIPSDSSEVDSLRSEGMSLAGVKTYFRGIVDDFVTEIQLMEDLKAIQNIVSVEDYRVVEREKEIGWDIFIRMELLTPFNSYLRLNPVNEDDVIRLGVELCTALEICSKKKIIHRDIKPENIFINKFGYFKLGDFGIAKKMESATASLSQKGTYNYMAPEVFSGTKYDERVDIYSLGIVLYRLLNQNRLPFLENEQQLSNPNERKLALDRRLAGETLPPPCEASKPIAAVILCACQYRPENRFASASAMKKALLQAQESVRLGLDASDAVPNTLSSADPDKTVSLRGGGGARGNSMDPNKTVSLRGGQSNGFVPASDRFAPNNGNAVSSPQSAKKLNFLCLLALLSCCLPLALCGLAFLSLAFGGEFEAGLWIPAMLLSLIPVFLANLGRRDTKRTGTAGNLHALIAMILGLFFFVFTTGNFFDSLDRNGDISSAVSALCIVGLSAAVAAIVIALYCLAVSKEKKK